MTAKRGLFWYVDGELLCFPVSGDEADTVSNNHRRFWETLPHSHFSAAIEFRAPIQCWIDMIIYSK